MEKPYPKLLIAPTYNALQKEVRDEFILPQIKESE